MTALLNNHLDLSKAGVSVPNSNFREVEIELWNSFRAGNREALNDIFEKYVRLLYVYGRSITRDQSLISDCIQDIFVELWVKRETLTPQVNSIKYYLFKSVRRRILRRLSADRRVVGQAIPGDYCEEVEFNIEFNLIRDQTSNDLSQQLKTSVATLSKGQREAIYLKFHENMTYEEIASVMNTDLKAVYNLVNRSITSLRKFFKTHCKIWNCSD
ncbi:MAG: sigma-70 family RNA polymerase sigma factor [Cyclobacteriaceae bacterium]